MATPPSQDGGFLIRITEEPFLDDHFQLQCRLRLGENEQAGELWRINLKTKPPRHGVWDGYAEFCLFRGRDDDYQTACLGLLEHFGATKDAFVAERTVRACLMTPVSGEILQRATALIDFALADKKPKPEWAHTYFLLAKGLAEYRDGRWESAITISDGPASQARIWLWPESYLNPTRADSANS